LSLGLPKIDIPKPSPKPVAPPKKAPPAPKKQETSNFGFGFPAKKAASSPAPKKQEISKKSLPKKQETTNFGFGFPKKVAAPEPKKQEETKKAAAPAPKFGFSFPKTPSPAPKKLAAPKKAAPAPKKQESSNFGFSFPKKADPVPKKAAAPAPKKAPPAPKFGISKPAAPKKVVEYSFPSESPPAKTESPKFQMPKFGGGSPPKKAAATKSGAGTAAAEAKAKANRLRQEEADRKKEEAAELRRRKQLEIQQKAEEAKQAAAERKRIQQQKQQEKLEAQRQAAEQRKQEAEQRKQEAEEKRRQALQEEKAVAAEKAVEKSIGQAKSRTTISLGNLFGGNDSQETKTTVDPSNPKTAAPSGVPVVTSWKQNSDGSISGRISGSPNFSEGEFVTTSPVPQGATSNSVVKSSSGSSYYLDQEQKSTGFGFGFGMNKSAKPVVTPPSPAEKQSPGRPSLALKAKAAAEERQKAAEEKRAAAMAAADERKAKAAAAADAKRQAAEDKKAKAAAVAEQRKAAAESKKQAEEEKRAKAAAVAEQRKAATEAKRQAEEEKRAKAAALAEQRKAAAEAKRQAQEEKKAKAAAVAEQRKAAAEAKKKAAEQKSTAFLQRKQTAPAPTASPIVEKVPKGVPVIKSWKQRSDGGISGRIYGSPNFTDGDTIETSPIFQGKVQNGATVSTKSKSRYFLSAETAAAQKSNMFGAFKDLAGARPGATITLTKERKERDVKAVVKPIEKTKPRATFSLFGFGGGGDSAPAAKAAPKTKGIPTKSVAKKAPAPKTKTAPNGVPTMNRWKMNSDGSVSGIITGSINFKEGELVTTSMITKGRIDQGEVVTTGSGSRYFLA